MMNKRLGCVLLLIVFLIALLLFTVYWVDLSYAQEADCVLAFDDNDDPGFYDEFSYTDPQGRTVCKVRVVFHDPAEGDPNGAVFTESGEVNGYTAAFDGASVHVWRSGSPYSISHSKVWVLEEAPPPTDAPPTDTAVPPTEIPPTPTDTATLPPGVTPSPTPTLPPGVTPSPTATVVPPVTNQPPADTPPGTTPGQPRPTSTPNKVMPQTGAGDNLGLWVAAGLGCGMLALLAGILRRAR